MLRATPLVVGASEAGAGNGEGAAYLFVKPLGKWKNAVETARLTHGNAGGGEQLGKFVAVTPNAVVATAAGHPPEGVGSAFVFVKPPGGWVDMTETAELYAGNQHQIKTGRGFNSVAMTDSMIFAGADSIQGKHRGALDTYFKPQTGWITTSTPNSEWLEKNAGNDHFPGALSTDGRVIVASVEGENYPKGAVLVFKKPH